MLLPRSRVAAWHGVKDAHQPLQQAARRGEACGVIYSFKIQLTSVEITETLQSVRQRCFRVGVRQRCFRVGARFVRQRCFRVGARFGAPAVHCTQANALARLIYHAQPRDCPQQGVRGRGLRGVPAERVLGLSRARDAARTKQPENTSLHTSARSAPAVPPRKPR